MDAEQGERADKAYEAVFISNGKDSLMARMKAAEKAVSDVTTAMDRIERKLTYIGVAILTVLGTMLAEMIERGIWK